MGDSNDVQEQQQTDPADQPSTSGQAEEPAPAEPVPFVSVTMGCVFRVAGLLSLPLQWCLYAKQRALLMGPVAPFTMAKPPQLAHAAPCMLPYAPVLHPSCPQP